MFFCFAAELRKVFLLSGCPGKVEVAPSEVKSMPFSSSLRALSSSLFSPNHYNPYQPPLTMPIATPTFPVPLVFSNSLPKTYSALTPAIGTEFAPETQVSSLLSSSAPSTSIRDLAILVSQRGVVFFREQDLTTVEQRELVDRLGKETGRPEESGLHVHPLGGTNELGGGGKEEVFKITAGEFSSLFLSETMD